MSGTTFLPRIANAEQHLVRDLRQGLEKMDSGVGNTVVVGAVCLFV